MMINVDNLAAVLWRLPLYERLMTFCAGSDAYVVGGAVRDALVGLPVQDVDLIFPEDPTRIAKAFAGAHGGHWFWLDEARKQSRVVFSQDEASPVFDFAPFRAPTLGLDLLDRDFTINSMAFSCSSDFAVNSLVDPVCGLEDLQKHLLRMVTKDSFANDPLRIVKGVRHATALGLQIEANTLSCMQTEVTGLYQVAPERIRQEIWKVLDLEEAAAGLRLLAKSLAGNYLFGNNFCNSVNDLAESLQKLRTCWRNLAHTHPMVKDWLAREVEQGLDCETLLVWTILLVRLDNALPGRLAEEWLLSRKAKAFVRALAGIDDGTLEQFKKLSRGPRAFAWWAYGFRVEPRLWLLALAAAGALRGADDSILLDWWVPVVDMLDDHPPEELVDGYWLRHEFGLPDGPEMSQALQLIRNAEISGLVDDPESARRYLVHYFKNID